MLPCDRILAGSIFILSHGWGGVEKSEKLLHFFHIVLFGANQSSGE